MTAQLETVSRKRTYTVDEFMALPDNGKRYELVDGKLVEMSGPSFEHGDVILRLSGYLFNYQTNNAVGKAVSGATFELNPKNGPVPDIAFVSAGRLPTGLDRRKAFPGPPDLAVEVMSPSDKWKDVVDKVRRYLQAGVKLVWIIDPFDQNVYVYNLNQQKKVLYIQDELDGEDVLPGFKLLVKTLFE